MAADEPTSTGEREGATSTTRGANEDPDAQAADGEREPSGDGAGREHEAFDLRGMVRQFTAPMIESLDARLREQVEAHVDELLDAKVEAALSARLATIERAIADLSKSLSAVEQQLLDLQRAGEPED